MIDPDDSTGELWKLEIKPRRKRLPSLSRDQAIAWRIAGWKNLGERMKWITDEKDGPIAAEFGVSRKTMYTAWRKHGNEMTKAVREVIKPDLYEMLSKPSDARRWCRTNKAQKDSN